MESWEEFKKELTWNNFKIGISAIIPMLIGAWIFTQWVKILNPVIQKYASNSPIIATPEHVIISLCLIMGLVLPIWPLLMWTCNGGLYLGKATRFYRYDKTRRIVFDDIEYFIRDMPQEQRDKIKEILSGYKSRLQLRKERLANKSWLRRNFT